MKFEHLLRIYWTRYFLFGGVTYPFFFSFRQLLRILKGVGRLLMLQLVKRFELTPNSNWWKISFSDPSLIRYRGIVNIFLAKLINVNGGLKEWEYINQMRIYNIRTYRGRSLALGKPSRGQRTWSNANTSKKRKTLFSSFISLMTAERKRKEAILLKKFSWRGGKSRVIKKRIKRRSNKQKRISAAINPSNFWF